MTDGNVLQKWKDYCTYFGGVDKKTAKGKLELLGFRCPKRGAPMIRLEALKKRIDEKALK